MSDGYTHYRVFADRADAGRALAEALAALRGRDDVIVLALPRGGVPVGHEIATALGAPLDVLIVRKLGAPGQPEVAMGAIASGGGRVINEEVVRALRIDAQAIEAVTAMETRELARRELAYRGNRPPSVLAGKVVIVVDDGMATGATMLAGVRALRRLQPARIIVAVPHAPPDTCAMVERTADELVCVEMPQPYCAVGRWYRDFRQLSDDEVRGYLARPGDSRS